MSVVQGQQSYGAFAGTESVDMESMPSLMHSDVSSGTDVMDQDTVPLEEHQIRIQQYGQQLDDQPLAQHRQHQQQHQQQPVLAQGQQQEQDQGQGQQHQHQYPYPYQYQQQQQQQQQQLHPQYQMYSLHYAQNEKQQQQQQLYHYHQQQRQQQPAWPRNVPDHQTLTPTVDYSAETEMPGLSEDQSTSSSMQSASPRLGPVSSGYAYPGPVSERAGGQESPEDGDEYFLTSTLNMIPPEMINNTVPPLAHFDYYKEFPQRQNLTKGGNGEIRRAFWPARQFDVILKNLIDIKHTPTKIALLFDKEVEVMRICGNHNNIVEFYGIATRQQQHQVERFMIMRYYERGDLVRLLERPQNPSEAPTLIDKLFLALDIAMGLEHLFRCGFHHGDLHPKNVLIDGRRDDSPSSTYYRARYQARLTDFGLRRIRDNRNAYSSQPLAGVQQFMAPERMYKNRPRYNVRCDIFALGVIYWYLIAERYPFKNSPILIPGQREERVEGTPDWYHALYTQAWHEDPNQRQQSLEEIIQVLHYQLRVSAVPFPTTGYQQYENSLHDRSAAAAAAYPTPSSGHDSLAPPSIPGYDRTHQQFFFPSVSGTALRGGPMGHQNLAVPPLYSGAPSSASAGPSTGASNMPSPTLTQTIASKASAAKSTNPSHPRNRKVVVPNGMPARGGYR